MRLRLLPFVCLLSSWPVLGQPAGGDSAAPTTQFRSCGDERTVDSAAAWTRFTAQNAGLIGSVARKPVSFAEALAQAHALAKGLLPADKLAALRARLPKDAEAAGWRLLAAREAMAGNADASFCLLVTASDAAPDNPDALCDLAGALAMLGRANEALAILDELARRGAAPSPPMGLSPDDVFDYLRGYCLLRLGDIANARAKLAGVADRQPWFTEATRLLALLDEKAGKNGKPLFVRSLWRPADAVIDAVKPAGDDQPGEQGGQAALNVRSFARMDKARRGTLPAISYPANPEEATARHDAIFQKINAEIQAVTSIAGRRSALKLQYYTVARGPETWGYRYFKLIESLDWRDPKIRELKKKKEELTAAVHGRQFALTNSRMQKAMQAWIAAKGQGTYARVVRPVYADAMSANNADKEALDRAIRDYFAEWNLLATALAAQVGNPVWREDILGYIEQRQSICYTELLNNEFAHDMLGWLPPLNLPPQAEEGQRVFGGADHCDGGKSIGVSVNSLGMGEVAPVDLGVEMTCEGISVEAGVSVFPGVQISGELGVDTKGGYSVFVGPKLDATIAGTGGTMKEGFVVSGSRGGGVTDVGMKMEAKVQTSVGGVSAATKVGEVSMSFLPGAQGGGPPADLVPL